MQKMETVRQALKEQGINISAGEAWRSRSCDLTALLKEADERMYQEKRKYYESAAGGRDRRGKRYV